MALILVFLLPRCATVPRAPIQEPLSAQTVNKIIAAIQEQEDKVSSFYAHGRLTAGAWYGQSEANFLVVGLKKPFKMKIEITQAWGQPILHVLIDQERLEILSFKDTTLYLAPFTTESLSRFFPSIIDPEFVWGTLRGYPNLLKHDRARSLRNDQITLYQAGDVEVEVIDLHPESHMPRLVRFPGKPVTLSFFDFQDSKGIKYAREVGVSQKGEQRRLTLHNATVVFNRAIPEQIFFIEKPPAFETRTLE